MHIKEAIEKILRDWPAAVKQQFAENPLAAFIRKDFKDCISSLVTDLGYEFEIKASPGAGNWASVPWLSILDSRITNTTQEGVYPVYLFRADSSGCYLSLNQGVSKPPEIYQKRAQEYASKISEIIRKKIPLNKWDTKPLDLRSEIGLGSAYQVPNIYSRFYELDKIPKADELIAHLKEVLHIYNLLAADWDKIKEEANNEIQKELGTRSKVAKRNQEQFMEHPLNTILYGPPGTGKTYRLKNEFFRRFTDESANQTEEEYLQDLVSNYSWWEIIAASLYDLKTAKVPNISEHPILKAKVAVSSNKNVKATLWGTLQAHTIQECEHVNYTNRQAPLIFNKNANSDWEVIEENLEAEAPEIIELVRDSKTFEPVTTEKKRYVFTTFHQSFSYEDFIEGIKPIVYEDEQNPEKGKQIIYDIKPGLFKKIVKEANADKENDYAIFIDEINRGNIANIFGELITLIEDDKRIGADNYTPAQLPYSNEDFGVPPNLYIIGTMNTADRSVEALDTALRRRFSFIEMNPDPAKLSEEDFKCTGIDLEALLNAINARIEKLLDKDYCIGHSYFMTIKNRQEPLEEIKNIFQNKILPLLQEYFYGDWGKILLVIGKEFVETKKDAIRFLSTDSYEDFEEYDKKPIYNFTKPSSWTIESFKSIYG